MNKLPEELDFDVQKIVSFAKDMEIIDNFVNHKGKYVGDMFLISVRDLADIIRNMERKR